MVFGRMRSAGGRGRGRDAGRNPFRFRVSDAFEVPLRGHMLRLRVVEGQPRVRDVAVGRRLRLISPRGEERIVQILAHAATGGRQTQQRLDETKELDVVISASDAGTGDTKVDIGWYAAGPEPS
jgi:hypothetical protein